MKTRIEELRKKHNLTQKALADLIGVTPSAISQYESGIRRPTSSIIPKLAGTFGVSPNYILGLPEEPKPKNTTTDFSLPNVKKIIIDEDFENVNLYISLGYKLLQIVQYSDMRGGEPGCGCYGDMYPIYILGWFENQTPPSLESVDLSRTDIDPDEYLYISEKESHHDD